MLELERGNLIGAYMYGDNDPMDAELLRFVGLNGARVLDIVRAEPSDEAAARRILVLSGKTRAECERFSRRLRRRSGIFLAMIDADENRLPPRFRTALLGFIYNRMIMPFAYAYFRRMEGKANGYRNARV